MSYTDTKSQEWSVLRAKLKDYLSIYDEPVASLKNVNTIPDAPICGGGKLTVALDGDHRAVNFHLSKSDFWAVVLKPETLFQKHHIRQAPLCRLGLTVHNAAEVSEGFRHVQDMAEAEIRSVLPLAGGVLNVRSVALAQQDLMVIELDAEDSVASLTVRPEADNENDNFFIMRGEHDTETVWLRKEHTSFITVNAAAALRVSAAENVRPVYDKGFVSGLSFDVKPGSTTRLLLSVKGGKDEYKHLEEALTALDGAAGDALPGLLTMHAEWWKAFWLKSWIDINDPLIERFYYGAQYVLGGSIDLDGRVAPGLAGGWITNPNPIWGGTYTMNYNGESPFWGLCSSNRGEFLLPYARVCLDYISKGRELAHRLDTKGIVMPVMIGPWGIEDNDDALGQKSNASMAALSLIWHWESTRDRDFLGNVLYPYLRELTDFWEDNLELDDSGRYVIKGSARERNPGDLNPGEDLAFVRRLLETAIAGSERLKLDEHKRDLWRRFLERLSDHAVATIDGDPCFKEAENRMAVSSQGVGDNVCALNHVYPGGSIDKDASGRGKIIARNTLRYLQSWDQENSFTRVFSQAVRAEWPGDDILDRFRRRIAGGEGPHEIVRRNNTFLPGGHSFEGTAATEFINSMLAQAHGSVLKVFHVWPEDRDASFERLRVPGAFLVSGELRGGEVVRVEIISEQGGTCRMQSCWPGRAVVVRRDGALSRDRGSDSSRDDSAEIPVTLGEQDGAYAWDTVPGGVYRVAAGDTVAEEATNPPVMMVPIIDPAAGTGIENTNATLDILLTPETGSTRLELDVVFADESRRRCTAECSFSSRDNRIAEVNSAGVINGAGRGRTTIDVVSEIDGERLDCCVSVYVLTANIISPVSATTGGKPWKNWNRDKHSLECLIEGIGTDSPDITALHRANSYGVGLFAVDPDDGNASVQFDFGAVHALDEMWIWNYNCPDDYRVLWWNGGTACGMRDVAIEISEDGERWTELTTEGHPFRLAKATGRQWMPATNLDDGAHTPVRFQGARARYVRLTPDPTVGIGNWGGELFGLSQVRFTRM